MSVAVRPDAPAPVRRRAEIRLRARVQVLEAGLEAAGEQVDPALAQRSRADLENVTSRLALGVDHTVVALVGGTGSGKSSLFNAVAGLTFADVGALRPTTQRAAACVWGGNADALLDFLSVIDHRRITRESVLDADREQDLAGLVLLDMPDHDSVAEGHSRQVDRLVPLVDVLVWVVDPQKYADNALHERYLRGLVDRQDAMVVVVNQVDTLPAASVATVVDGVRALLAEDGLDSVPVLPTSAVTGEGVAEVRAALARAVARPTIAARTAEAELDAVAARLAAAAGAAPVSLRTAVVDHAAEALTRAAGVDAVARSVRTAGARVRRGTPAQPQPPARATVEAVRSRWLQQTTAGLPPRWTAAVDDAVASGPELARASGEAVRAAPLPSLRRRGAAVAHWAGVAIVVLGLVALAGGALALPVLGALTAPALAALAEPVGWEPTPLPLLVGGATAVVLGAVLVLAARRSRRSSAERLAAAYRSDATDRVRSVVEAALAQPTVAVLDRHRRLWESVRA